MQGRRRSRFKPINLLFLALLIPLWLALAVPAKAVETLAKQAILVEMATGEVLFEKKRRRTDGAGVDEQNDDRLYDLRSSTGRQFGSR